MPAAWQEYVHFKGLHFLIALLGSQVVGYLSPLKNIDYVSHLAGTLVGIISAHLWKSSRTPSELSRDRRKHLRWYEILLGKQSTDK